MSNKNIIIVGVLNRVGSTNVSLAKAFIQYGFNVIPINYRTIIYDYGIKEFENVVIKSVEFYKPQLVIFCKCNGINPELVKHVTQYTKTWLWNPDPINTIAQCKEVVQHARYATYSSCTGGAVVKWFEQQGVTNCRHIFEGCDTDVYKPVEPIEKLKATISFIGTKTALRDSYKALLEKNGYDVKFYGPGYTSEIVNDAFAQVCSSSRYMLSVNTQNDLEDYFSDRVFRYMSCGSCVLHLDQTETTGKYFIDNEEIVLFRNEQELLNKLQSLDNETVSRISKNARSKIMSSHTWKHTVSQILKIVLNDNKGYVVDNTAKKVLVVFPHGLGDHVMLTPGLRKYKELNPNTHITIASLQRFGDTVKQLLSNLPYIDEFLPVLPDPWNDFESYNAGWNAIENKIKSEYGNVFDTIKFIYTKRCNGFRLHKIFRIADELGVQFNTIDELQTELSITKEACEEADKLLSQYTNKIVVLHNKAGNPIKNFPAEDLEKAYSELFSGYDILEFGQKSIECSNVLPEDNMELTKAIISKADAVCAIDSVVMHIAGAFRKNLVALFKTTPVHQAVPLFGSVTVAGYDNEITELSKLKSYKQDIETYFSQLKIDTTYNSSVDNSKVGGKRDSEKRWRYIVPKLSNKIGKLLDVGCNNGYFSIKAAQLGFKVLGLDTDPKMIESAKNQAIRNVKFEILKDNLLHRLSQFDDNEFEFTFYMSVHHHMYEQYSEEIANDILTEIGRISKNVIFDMGQSNEESSKWTPWSKLIPEFEDHRIEIPEFISLKLGIDKYHEVICSERIHGVDRWLFLFSKRLPKHIEESVIRFGNKEYKVLEQIQNRYKKKEDVRYFKVSDDQNIYFVKEILYNNWLSNQFYPNDSLNTFAMDQFSRGQKVREITDKAIVAKAISNNFLLFDFCNWKNLINVESISQSMFNRIADTASKIWAGIGEFDVNINNILVEGDDFRFIDFEFGKCSIEERLSRIHTKVR